MDSSPEDVETDLVDLSEVSVSTMDRYGREALAAAVRRLLAQIDRPRFNLGSSGNPGRRVD